MNRIEVLEESVRKLYADIAPSASDWATWLGANHVFVVALLSKKIAEEQGADAELSYAGGLLHDIADTCMQRKSQGHSEMSESIATTLLTASGFTDQEIDIVVHDAMKFHGCRNNALPRTLEGKVVATADALAHLETNFYEWAVEKLHTEGMPVSAVSAWVAEKSHRDFFVKIFFDSYRSRAQKSYERVTKLII
ncbi:MAG: HD domain-containing protein [Minisyncoccia bacterium]